MSKIDLIIDALNSFTQRTVDVKSGTRRMCCGDSIEEKHTQHCIGLKALAAAYELKAIYPQGAKVRPAEFIATASIGVGADFVGTPMIWAEWPTRSEEVKHEDAPLP